MERQLLWICIVFAFSACVMNCGSVTPGNVQVKQGLVISTFELYNTAGEVTMRGHTKVWYRDSIAIEEINLIKVEEDINGRKIANVPMFYRFIDLHRKMYRDYQAFSDTSTPSSSKPLPDSVFTDHGWSFYSDKALQILGTPEMLTDTIIRNITYKRMKFNFVREDPAKNFRMGYLRCDNKGIMFSEEKRFSKKMNCTMTKILNYHTGKAKPRFQSC